VGTVVFEYIVDGSLATIPHSSTVKVEQTHEIAVITPLVKVSVQVIPSVIVYSKFEAVRLIVPVVAA
jgi:hypothetical protein